MGKFIFTDVIPGAYWIVVRNLESEDKHSGRGLIDTSYNKIDVYGAHITYAIMPLEEQ